MVDTHTVLTNNGVLVSLMMFKYCHLTPDRYYTYSASSINHRHISRYSPYTILYTIQYCTLYTSK